MTSEQRSVAGGRVYGLLAVAGLEAAFSLELLREVIPDPGVYQPVPLPQTAPGLLGTIVLRELIIPVYDLADRLGAPGHDGGGGHVVAVLVQGERVLGLRADGVKGLARVADSELQRLAANTDERPIFSACFHHAESGTVTSVLDGEAIFALPGIATTTVAVSAAERAERAGATVGGDGDGEVSTIMLFEVGEHRMALDVAVVAMVLPAVDLAPSVLDGRICRGVTGHLGLQVPVVDPAAHTGLGSLDADQVRQAVLLQLRRGYVALAITDMRAVVRVRRSELKPLPAVALGRPERFAGLYESDGRRYLVLDRAVLEADTDLDTLSALNTADADHAATGGPDGAAGGANGTTGDPSMARGGATYLTYDIGCTVATPLHEVAEIIGHPSELIDARSGQLGVRGSFVHRDAVVPLVDLAALLGPASPAVIGPSSPVLLVPCGSDTVAFAVGGLHAIETSVWETAPDDPAASMNGAGGRLDSAPLIEIATDGPDGAGRLVPRVSLVVLAAEVLGRPLDAGAPSPEAPPADVAAPR